MISNDSANSAAGEGTIYADNKIKLSEQGGWSTYSLVKSEIIENLSTGAEDYSRLVKITTVDYLGI